MAKITIGARISGVGPAEFSIPLEGVTKAYAINGIRESGKSSLGTVMAEEFCKVKQPWIAFDPAGNWWGLRAKADGSPGGFPVVVFGGERGDLPLERDSGRAIAEAITAANVFAVIDLKSTSKTMWRILVRDIVKALQEIQVEVPRMVFIEEAQEFLPQKASHQLGAECKEIVERLVTLGGNWGYGATIIGQRPASIEKSALSQCETVFAFATQGKHDRDALTDWMESNEVGEAERAALKALADLPTGECYVWSPRFLKTFARLRIRRRETFHPREARRLGVAVRDIELAPVADFVAKLRKTLTKTQAAVPDLSTKKGKGNPKPLTADRGCNVDLSTESGKGNRLEMIESGPEIERLRRDAELKGATIARLSEELRIERRRREDAHVRLENVRAALKPQFDALSKLFGEIGNIEASGSAVDRKPYERLYTMAKERGCGKMLEALFEKPELTKNQLGILSGVPAARSTFRTYMAWLKRAGLVEVHGETVKLRAV